MKTGYEEGPWVYKRGDTYYIEYAAGGVPEHMAYSTAKVLPDHGNTVDALWRKQTTVLPYTAVL